MVNCPSTSASPKYVLSSMRLSLILPLTQEEGDLAAVAAGYS